MEYGGDVERANQNKQSAKLVRDKITCEIIVKESNDNRSYRQNSDKIASTGFDQKFFVEDVNSSSLPPFPIPSIRYRLLK